MKRIFLFVATNVAILAVLAITANVLGLERILDDRGVSRARGRAARRSARERDEKRRARQQASAA